MSRVKSCTVQWMQKDVFLPVVEHYVKSEVLYCPVGAERCVFASCRALCQEWSLVLSSECRNPVWHQLAVTATVLVPFVLYRWSMTDWFVPLGSYCTDVIRGKQDNGSHQLLSVTPQLSLFKPWVHLFTRIRWSVQYLARFRRHKVQASIL